MSLKAAAEFLKQIHEDEQLAEQIQSASKDEVLPLARSLGCEMSMEEFKLVLLKTKEFNNDELTDEELEQVSAGVVLTAGAIYSICCLAVVVGIKVYIKGDDEGWW